jgi:hypothetical protein
MHDTQAPPGDPHGLFHRWFVEYNPLYLVSAALVLVGVDLLLRGLEGRADVLGYFGITAIAEVYAWALIGSAALLVRIRLRRPAVMLALLAAAYQCDPMLHTETCAHLDGIGKLATLVWIVVFVAKLRALAWAMRLRLSASAFVVATVGGLGLALLPWMLREYDAQFASALVATWLFSLFAVGAWSLRRIASVDVLDAWGVVVARRSFRAVWLGWGAAVIVHVLFWRAQYPFALHLQVLVPVALLLVTRLCRRESHVWAWTGGALAIAAVHVPSQFALVACMAAATLALRALRQPVVPPTIAEAPPRWMDPYRASDDLAAPPRLPEATLEFVVAQRTAMLRLLAGALGCVYLAAWTHAWIGGPWPEHAWWLDLVLLAVTVVWAKSLRDRLPLVLPAVTALHGAIEVRLVSAPESILQWGATCVAVGFVCLLLALVASVRWRNAGQAGG